MTVGAPRVELAPAPAERELAASEVRLLLDFLELLGEWAVEADAGMSAQDGSAAGTGADDQERAA